MGPGALISDGLLKELEEPSLGYTLIGADYIHTYHSLIPPTNEDPVFRSMNRPIAVSAVNKRVTEQVYEHASQGRYVLTLGGDHSLAVGTIAGLAQAVRERHQGQEIAVIWVDAHADINTPETTRTGNIHGMPLSFATGIAREDRDDVFGWIKPAHLLNPKKLVYIAIRAVGQGELGIIRDHGIKAFTMEDVVECVTDLITPSRKEQYTMMVKKSDTILINHGVGVPLGQSWTRPWSISGPTRQSFSPSTLMRWIRFLTAVLEHLPKTV